MVVTAKGIVIRISIESVAEIGRATQGVRMMKPDAGDRVVSIARVVSTVPKDPSAEE
jgi:DNA gyrase subunit A